MFRKEDGTSIVEFAIIAPLLFVMTFGIIEFGILLFDKAMLTNASREGARAGIVFSHPDRLSDSEIVSVVKNYCENHLISFDSSSEVTVSITRTGTSAGDSLTVNLTYPFRFLVFSNLAELLGGGIQDLVNLNAISIMRME